MGQIATQTPSSQPQTVAAQAAKTLARLSDRSDARGWLDTDTFEQLWRAALVLAKSALIPAAFHGKVEDCFLILQLATRLRVDPIQLLQKTYVSQQGKPAFEAQAVIGIINASGMFDTSINYELTGKDDDYGCVAWAIRRGERVNGPRVTIGVAKAEGWYTRNAKWKSIPQLMLCYRAAAWFSRLHCPEIIMGMTTAEEMQDIGENRVGKPKEATVLEDRLREPTTTVTGFEVLDSQPAPEVDAPAPEVLPDFGDENK